jgi:hypothetical protein
MTGNEGAISGEDREKILASARDYIESWLDADAQRMARCLHPQLVKRESLEDDPSAETMTRDQMIQAAGEGRGKRSAPTRYRSSMSLGISQPSGSSHRPMDYLHVTRSGDAWLLLNVLWQRRPGR